MEVINNFDNSFNDSSIVTCVRSMRLDCQEIEKQVTQKQQEIGLQQENVNMLKTETETQQRQIEMCKIELLKEQDNYDNMEKKLNEETESLSGTAEGQEVLSKQTKFYVDQVYKAIQFQDKFEKEVSTINHAYVFILLKFKEYINKQTMILSSLINKKAEISSKNLPAIQRAQHLEEQLNVRASNVERLFETLHLQFNKKNAVLEYLKAASDEISIKNKELLFHLEDEDEIHGKDNEYAKIIENIKVSNEKLQNVKQNLVVDSIYLGHLQDDKIINNDLTRFETQKAYFIEKHKIINNIVSNTENEIEELKASLNKNNHLKEECCNLTERLKVLQNDQIKLIDKNNETNNLIKNTKETCNEIKATLEALVREKELVNNDMSSLSLKKASLQNIYDERNELNCNELQGLVNEVTLLTDKKCILDQEFKNRRNELESNVNILDNCLHEIQEIKLKLKYSSDSVLLLQDEIKVFESTVNKKDSRLNMDMSNLRNIVSDKERLKGETEVEIDKLTTLRSEIVNIEEQCRAMHLVQQSDINTLKETFVSELKVKQNELECKTQELESKHKEKMTEVADLNSDIIEVGRNELYLSKRIQEYAHTNETKKREIKVLYNAINTLNMKLCAIAKAVASQDKTSVGSNQSTVILSQFGYPHSIKPVPQRTTAAEYDYDSSSSGVSVCGNMASWRKEIIRRQQSKRENYIKSQNSQACSSVVSNEITLVDDNPVEKRQK